MRDLRGGETIDIDLREQTLEGTVVVAVTRQPIAGALVTLAPFGMMQSIAAEVPTDTSVRFRLVPAVAGQSMRLMVAAHGYGQRTKPVSATAAPYVFDSPARKTRASASSTARPARRSKRKWSSSTRKASWASAPAARANATYLFSLTPGRYRVMTVVQGFEPKTVEATAPGALEIVLE